MSFRFRRRVTLAPGLRLNISKGGVSLTAGPRGASVTAGKQGIYRNLGLPGTGLSHRTRIGGLPAGGRVSGSVASGGVADIGIALSEQGWVQLLDATGGPLPEADSRRVREAFRGPIQAWLGDEVERINAGIDRILDIHLETPPPETPGPYLPVPFSERRPERPSLRDPGGIVRLVKPWRRAVEERNSAQRRAFSAQHAAWEERREAHQTREAERTERSRGAMEGEPAAMRGWIAEILAAIDWPRETEVAYEVTDDGRRFLLDVDLPPPEEMPSERAELSRRPFKLNVAERSDRRLREVYARHVHGVGFRLAGEAFRHLPTVEEVVVSGFTQRIDDATGQEVDDYLYSARISRKVWGEIDFARLEAVDPIAAFDRFDLRRDMTPTGIFRPVEPWPEAGG